MAMSSSVVAAEGVAAVTGQQPNVRNLTVTSCGRSSGSQCMRSGSSTTRRRTRRQNYRGLQQLSIWMDDLIRGGIGGLEDPYSFWDEQARRLWAQAKGLAGRIRNLLNSLGIARLAGAIDQRIRTNSTPGVCL